MPVNGVQPVEDKAQQMVPVNVVKSIYEPSEVQDFLTS